VGAVEELVEEGAEADEVLRGVVETLRERGGYAWAGIFFVEQEQLVLGPNEGEPDERSRRSVPVRWQGERVAELAVDGGASDHEAVLARIAELVAAHCLVGWDTGGEPWA
jgi:hypothetical protein